LYFPIMSRLLALILLVPALCVQGQRSPAAGYKQLQQAAKGPQSPIAEKPDGAPPTQLVATPAYDLPEDFQVEPALDASKKPTTPGARFVKIRQGPFTIAVGETVTEEEQWIAEPKMPCNHCYVTALQAGVEFEDGTQANTNQGAMLQVSRPRVWRSVLTKTASDHPEWEISGHCVPDVQPPSP
jgi:hypothetical protein